MLCLFVINEVNINKSNDDRLPNIYHYRKTEQTATIVDNYVKNLCEKQKFIKS